MSNKMKNFMILIFLCIVSTLGLTLAGGYGYYGYPRVYGYETNQIHPSYGHYPGGYSHVYEHRVQPYGH